MRLGLCCKFLEEPIRFRASTATALLRMERSAALEKVSHFKPICWVISDCRLVRTDSSLPTTNTVGSLVMTDHLPSVPATTPLRGQGALDP